MKQQKAIPRLAWRVTAASVQGVSHQRSDQPCQDHFCWRESASGVLMVAVADGAGSARYGRTAAGLAATTAVDFMETRMRAKEDRDAWWEESLRLALAAALGRLKIEAEGTGMPLVEYGTTLILVAASPALVAAVQVGDGATVIASRKGEIVCLTRPRPQEFLNETAFLASAGAVESAEVMFRRGLPRHMAVFSDGLQMLALKMPECYPHRPFFDPLWQFADGNPDPSAAEAELTGFLSSPRVTARTDDDLTLVLASLDWRFPGKAEA
jgi:hypothetical protein